MAGRVGHLPRHKKDPASNADGATIPEAIMTPTAPPCRPRRALRQALAEGDAEIMAAGTDWAGFRDFLEETGRADGPLVIALFPPDASRPCVHVRATAATIPTDWIDKRLHQQPDLALGLVMNHPLPKPADWGSKPEHLNGAGKPRAWGASDAHVSHAIGIWAECDGGLAVEAQQALPQLAGLPEPSLRVWSGSRSLHLYWLLQAGEDLAPAAFKGLQQRLAARLAEVAPDAKPDRAICNAARLMRAPGGVHPRTGHRCVIHSRTGRRFTAAELLEMLPEPPAPAAAAPAPAPAAAGLGEPVPLHELLPRDLLQSWQEGAPEGQRNSTAFALAAALVAVHDAAGAAGLPTDGTPEDALLQFASRCRPPLPNQEVRGIFRSACSAPRTTDPGWPERLRWQLNRRFTGHRQQHQTAAAPPPAPPTATAPPAPAAGGAGATGPDPAPAGVVSRRTRVGPEEVLTLLPYHLGRLRLNVRNGEVHSSARGVISANEISRMYLELSRPFEVWAKDPTADGITLLASRDPFDPVREWLEGLEAEPLPLDQWHRLDQHLLGIDDPIAASFLPRFLISAIARTMEPGAYVRQVPVLIGAQERGKGELGRILFGADHWVEGVGALDRDALMKAHTAWGVELAELDGVTRRADQEHLKAFITETRDTYRKPYDRAPECHARKFVFWGTANRPPLRDSSGSTRFVCIPIPDRPLPLEWARQNRAALWARAFEQYRAGVTWLRTSEAERLAVEARNADFTELDPWADPVADFLRRAQTEGRLPVRVPEVLAHLEVPRERQTTAAAKRVREIAEAQGWRHARRWVGRERPQGLWPPSDGHPGHTPDTPRGVCSDPSDANGSGHVGHPRHPYSQTVEEVGGGQRAGTPATAPTDVAREVLSPEGCPVCPQPQNDCGADDLSEAGGVSIGVSGGVSIPSTVTGWAEAACDALKIAPHPAHLAEVLTWLDQHPTRPGCTRVAVASALERLRADDDDQPSLGLEVQP